MCAPGPYGGSGPNGDLPMILTVAGAVVVAFAIIMGVLTATNAPAEDCQFKHTAGDTVTMKLDGQEGMVVGTWQSGCKYRVRFAVPAESTSSSLLGGTYRVSKQRYTKEWVSPYELR